MEIPKKIAVIMATYNGADYIDQQIQSIAQSFDFCSRSLDYRILVRDDLSTDGTVDHILAQKKSGIPISLIEDGQSLGFKQSFRVLLNISVQQEFDYIFFSDQDDIWRKDKVDRFLRAFTKQSEKIPAAVFSDLLMFGSVLTEPIRMSHYDSFDHSKDNFQHWIFSNNVTGAALAINRRAANVLNDVPEDIWELEKYHDWLLIRLVSAVGTWLYLSDDLTLYRQHSNNVSRNWSRAGFHIPNLLNFWNFSKQHYWKSMLVTKRLYEFIEQKQGLSLNQGVADSVQVVDDCIKTKKIRRLSYFKQLSTFLIADRKSVKRKKVELFIALIAN